MDDFNIELKASKNCIKANFDNNSDGITISFSGAIDDKNPEDYLLPFFIKVHEKIVETNTKYLNLNLKELTFLNSSGIKCFVQLVSLMLKLPEDKRYNLKMKIDASSQWQNTSFSLLKTVNKEHIVIEKI
ncbi:MAG TPA: hypothetical protein PK771_13220 [Spirochaetota bacterium]|nr:hypothetical protein [Spirochaetota bacterium]